MTTTSADGAAARDFLRDVRAFDGLGRPTVETEHDGIPYFVNEFWTAGQRRGHSLHEVSYRACFKPQLPAFFIDRLTRPDDVVHDPFMGRGTTPLQAALAGRRAYGADINPLSELLVRPRLRPVGAGELAAALDEIDLDRGARGPAELLAFYHPETLRGLEALRAWIAERAPLDQPAPDRVADWVRMVALTRLSGHSPGFFSARSMPPNQAVSARAQRRINERGGVAPPRRDIRAIIRRKSAALLRDGPPPVDAASRLFTAPAWATPDIPDGGVDLVVTSPPFLDVVQYADDNWLRCWFAGIDASRVGITTQRTGDGWRGMVRAVLSEQARLVRPGGFVAFEVGEVRGGRVLLERLVWSAAGGLPFDRLGVVVNAQHFTKTANCWGIANGRAGTNSNRIVILQRH